MAKIFLNILVVTIAITTVSLIVMALVQKIKESYTERNHLKKMKSIKAKARKKDALVRKSAPAKLQLLLQSENKNHFEKLTPAPLFTKEREKRIFLSPSIF